MTESPHIAQEDLALHAMQSLPEQEAAAIRAHLAACTLCRSELTKISGDLALVGLSVEPQTLPQGARQRFLDRIAAEPVSEIARQNPASPQSTPPVRPQSVPLPRRRPASVWVPWLAAAAMGIVAIALGVQNRSLNDELRDESGLLTNLAAKASHAQQVLEVLNSPSAQRVTLTPGKAPEQPMGRATYLTDRGGLIFQASNLKPLPPGKTYELWVIPASGKAPMPAGTFQPDAFGAASVVMPPLPPGIPAKAFAVTMEKDGGAESPTMPILLAGTVPGT